MNKTHTDTHMQNPDHTRLPTYTQTHMSTHKDMRAYTHAQTLIHTGIHTNICTRTSRKYSQTRSQSLARERARTHTIKRTHTHHAPAYAMGATAVHTLLSSYAHTITLLCRRSHDEMRGVRVERRNGYSNETGCVVFIASGTQCRAHSYPMLRPLSEG